MSEFSAPVVILTIKTHPNADAIEIAEVAGYQSIVGKGSFKTGDLAVYIPEQAVLPDALIEKLGLTGRLAGSKKNRVKAIKLRGVVSQGLICPLEFVPGIGPSHTGGIDARPGDNVVELLGLTKYEPVVPATLSGDVWYAGLDRTLKYDIENVKRWDRVLEPGEQVVFTEKVHGTWCCMALFPESMADQDQGNFLVTSKGQSAKGLAYKCPVRPAPQSVIQKLRALYWGWQLGRYEFQSADMPDSVVRKQHIALLGRKIKNCFNKGVNQSNTYWRVAAALDMDDRMAVAFGEEVGFAKQPVFVLGEVYGPGIQDLGYGAVDAQKGFRIFDIYVGVPGQGAYLSDQELTEACEDLGVPRVPVLYRGPFSEEVMLEHTGGKETISGNELHVREGIVIRPQVERTSGNLGRVQLKSINEKYLLRKGDTTEFN